MNDEQRRAVEAAYLRGDSLEDIATAAGVSVKDADTYLIWWCDRGCPLLATEAWLQKARREFYPKEN